MQAALKLCTFNWPQQAQANKCMLFFIKCAWLIDASVPRLAPPACTQYISACSPPHPWHDACTWLVHVALATLLSTGAQLKEILLSLSACCLYASFPHDSRMTPIWPTMASAPALVLKVSRLYMNDQHACPYGPQMYQVPGDRRMHIQELHLQGRVCSYKQPTSAGQDDPWVSLAQITDAVSVVHSQLLELRILF